MFVETAPAEAPWLTSLNTAQADAVSHDSGHLLIVAGAGTGKTKTLAARVASLIETGADPDRILLLTFTRRAAQEMLDRVAALTDRRWASQIWGGTFHAVANRILRANAETIGLSPSFTVLDPGDANDLIGLVRAELHELTKVRRFPRADTIAAMHSRMVNSQEKLASVVDEHFPWCAEHVDVLKVVLREYVARKRAERV
ncbi:MAG: UvrD-helicase domain-containing protein, partial [Actinomycetota bacterium]|nr:UvrD-helicase domain-containing protein [Actinomycetota bacterium]